MPPPGFTCWQCNKQFCGLWSVRQLRCPFCGAAYNVQRRELSCACCANGEHSRNGQLRRIFSRMKGENNGKQASNSMSPPMQISNMTTISSRPQKRALICAVTYQKRKYRLKGTINDAKNMEDLLINHFKFPEYCIRTLTDKNKNEDRRPTKKNILDSLRWLVEDCRAGDSLVFYFSGHGLQQIDDNGDEDDGFDETICPTDFLKEGMIVDDEINEAIVRPLVKDVKLLAIIDSCHSGTILDLAYVYNKETKKWEDNIIPSGARKTTSGGWAICLSACEDDKLAADSSALERKKMNGVMTYLLAEIARNSPGLSYGGLMDKISEKIIALSSPDNCFHTPLLSKIFCHKELLQTIQLSSSEKFDVYNTHFTL